MSREEELKQEIESIKEFDIFINTLREKWLMLEFSDLPEQNTEKRINEIIDNLSEQFKSKLHTAETGVRIPSKLGGKIT